jgi:indolepyruvate ferredoxin oxidoreductase, beta subunit
MTRADTPRSIRIAILAMGGEGGGVLADWIVDMGEENGYLAQMTSVPGVAQRTGATIYYIELFPTSAIPQDGSAPVLALMPVPGDVDVVVCSELMEAARAIQRGFVTPDRTTLITSTHRVFAMTEKIALGDGRVDPVPLRDACAIASKQLVAYDMAAVAERTGSVISAVMFGALARSGALPFSRAAFEATIERGGVGVAPSLRAFSAGYEGDTGADSPETSRAARAEPRDISGLIAQADSWVPVKAREIVRVGVERMVDYQDLDYARSYLSRLERVAATEKRFGDGSDRLFTETARFLALGMGYEDTIRVAELKTRQARFERVRQEVQAKDGQIVEIAEYMHPRLQEIAETVPAPLGRLLLKKGPVRWAVERLTSKGRVIKTTSISGFLILSAVASLRPLRARSLRYEAEQAHLSAWLDKVIETAALNYDLGVEVAECLNLVKGYGDTHERGHANYSAILQTLPVLATRPDAAASVAALRQAALADDTGAALRNLLDRFSVHAPPNPSKSSPSAVGKAA